MLLNAASSRAAALPQQQGQQRQQQRRAAPAAAAVAAAAEQAEPAAPPSRGVLLLPGLANNAADYAGLAQHLRDRGLAVRTVPIGRPDWLRNAAALTDRSWWRGELAPRPATDWFLTRAAAELEQLKRDVDGAPITLVAHSAGGWLGRVLLLDFCGGAGAGLGRGGVDRFVTLGSPHQPPPKGAPGVVDQTRGILNWVDGAAPGAHHPEVKYVTIAGKFVRGAKAAGEGSLLAKFAGAGYQQVCGEAEVDGDFIVPLPAAHLPGAVNVDLEGVFHSPLGATLPFFGDWYGSDAVVDAWAHWATDDWDSLRPGDYVERPAVAAAQAAAAAAAASS